MNRLSQDADLEVEVGGGLVAQASEETIAIPRGIRRIHEDFVVES